MVYEKALNNEERGRCSGARGRPIRFAVSSTYAASSSGVGLRAMTGTGTAMSGIVSLSFRRNVTRNV